MTTGGCTQSSWLGCFKNFSPRSVRVISDEGGSSLIRFKIFIVNRFLTGFGGRSSTSTLRMFNQVELRAYKRELMFNKTSALNFKLNILIGPLP